MADRLALFSALFMGFTRKNGKLAGMQATMPELSQFKAGSAESALNR